MERVYPRPLTLSLSLSLCLSLSLSLSLSLPLSLCSLSLSVLVCTIPSHLRRLKSENVNFSRTLGHQFTRYLFLQLALERWFFFSTRPYYTGNARVRNLTVTVSDYLCKVCNKCSVKNKRKKEKIGTNKVNDLIIDHWRNYFARC